MSSHEIELHDVSCSYGNEPVIRNVSLRIPAGQFVCLMGPSGAGKTTLLRAMLGLVPRVAARSVGGRVVAPERPPETVGYVPQIETVDWNFPVTVQDVVMMGRVSRMGMLPWPSREDRRAASDVLRRLGIGGLERRHIRDLSGGQQQRTFLARALIGEPRILILDEPTASVDIKTRDDILHLLVDLNRSGVTIVMTTHELNAVAAHLPWVVCVNGAWSRRDHRPESLPRQFSAAPSAPRCASCATSKLGECAGCRSGQPRPVRDPPVDPMSRCGCRGHWRRVRMMRFFARAIPVRVLPSRHDRRHADGRALRDDGCLHRLAPDELHRARALSCRLRWRRRQLPPELEFLHRRWICGRFSPRC